MSIDQLRTTRERPYIMRAGRGLATVVGIGISTAASSWAVGKAFAAVNGNKNELWLLSRAAGITSYALMLALVLLGILLSHPWRARWRRPSPASRIRLHVSLAAFALVFTVLHVVVLVNDKYAGVGLRGALLPMGATYRPMPVTLGWIGLVAGLVAGMTALLAGRIMARVWWPIHKVAAVSFALVWVHSVLAGSDSPALKTFYYGTATVLVVTAITRYSARNHADLVAELTESTSGRGQR